MGKNFNLHQANRCKTLFFALLSLLLVASITSPVSAYMESIPPLSQNLWVTNGPVNTALLSGSTLYIGGSFTQVGAPTGGWVGLRADTAQRRTDLPYVAGAVYAMVSDGSGGWYIGGDFSAVNGVTRNNLAHINPDNTLDSAWNLGADKAVYALVLNGNLLYIGGIFSYIGGQPRTCIAAVNITTGSLSSWAPAIWMSGSTASVNALVVSGNTIYVGGYFDHVVGLAHNNLAALDIGSGDVMPWAPNPNSTVLSMALSGSTLAVGGFFTLIGGMMRSYLAAINTSTGNVTGPNLFITGGGMFPSVSSLRVNGSVLYVGGQFSQIGIKSRNSLAAVDMNAWTVTDWDPNVYDATGSPRVSALAVDGNTLYAGGNFTRVGGVDHKYIAAVDLSTGATSAWDPGISNAVSALAASSGTVFAGGSFTMVGGVERSNLAALDLATGQATTWNPNVRGIAVNSMALSGNILYIGGLFNQVGEMTRNNVAAVDATNGSLLPWNPDANNWVEALAVYGNVVFAGGAFVNIGGQGRFNLAALDATTGNASTTWTVQTNGPTVYALAVDNGILYVGGEFSTLGGLPRNNAGAIDITTKTVKPWNPNVTSSDGFPSVDSLAVAGTNVYIGGHFDKLGVVVRNNLAAVTVAGSLTSWNPNVGGIVSPWPAVGTLVVSGNTVFAGGEFTQVGVQTRNNIAALDISTAAVRAWDPGALSGVNALIVNNGVVYAGGRFLAIANLPQAYIAPISTVTVQTNPPTNISGTSATLNGVVTAYADPATSADFEWGTTSGGPYPNVIAASPSPVNSSDPAAVTATLNSFEVGTTYYYRLRATTSGGGMVYGAEQSFRYDYHTFLSMVVR